MGTCENPLGLSICASPVETVGPSWEVIFAGLRLHTACKGVSDYSYHC